MMVFSPVLTSRDPVLSMPASAQVVDRLAYGGLWVFLFCIPWGDTTPMLGGLVFTNWVGFFTVGAAVLRLALKRSIRRPSGVHYLMMAWVGWAVLSYLWSVDPAATLVRARTYLQILALVWIVWEMAVDQRRLEGVLKAYCYGAGVASAFVFWNFFNGLTASDIYEAEGIHKWKETRFTIMGINENDLGLVLALSIPMAGYLLASRHGLKAIPYWLLLTGGLTASLLTGSRGALLSSGLALLITLTALVCVSRRQRYMVPLALAVIIAAGAYLIPDRTWTRLLKFGSEVSAGTMTHRTVLWAAGLEAFREHPVAGVGAGAYGQAIFRAVDKVLVAHNTFLSILVELGVVGAGLFLALLACLVYLVLHMHREERWVWMTVLLTWGVGVSALTWEYRKPTWIVFAAAVAQAHARRRVSNTRLRPGLPESARLRVLELR